jgi:hypothetical protein
MPKVTDMIGDAAQPRGELGYAVPDHIAQRICGEMRRIMNQDLEECDIAMDAHLFNLECCRHDAEELIAAWEFLNPGERRAWRAFVEMGKRANQ